MPRHFFSFLKKEKARYDWRSFKRNGLLRLESSATSFSVTEGPEAQRANENEAFLAKCQKFQNGIEFNRFD